MTSVAPIDAVLDSIGTLRAAPRAEATRPELQALRRAIDQLELHFSERAAAFAAADEWEDSPQSAVDEIRHACKMGTAAAGDRLAVGRNLERLPLSGVATDEGKIGFGHLALMARIADALAASSTAGGFDEDRLLEQAMTSSVSRFRYYCQHARHASDPEGVTRDEVFNYQDRSLEIVPFPDGMISVNARLDAVGGALLRTSLEPLSRRLGADDDRSRQQRLADALIELAKHSLDNPVTRRSNRPHLQITAPLETLLGIKGAPAADLQFSDPISARALERLACDCTVMRVIFNSKAQVVDIGRAQRVISGSRRRALNARDRHCQWPGCDRKPSWCDGHHLTFWSRGGASDFANEVLLCWHHHWRAHEGGWQLLRNQHGNLYAVPPPLWRMPPARAPGSSVVL